MKFFAAALRISALVALLALAFSVAAQPAFPNKPIRVIVPYPPGGAVDVLARIVGQKLTESVGQQVIIDNRGGGNTIIGTQTLLRSPPDGYTIMLAVTTLAVLPSLETGLPYDTLKDLAPTATISLSPLALVIHPSVAANNLSEFIALAKSKPGQFNYGGGIGSTPHLAGAMFENVAGVKMQHIPFKGSGSGLPDLLSGRVELWFFNALNVISYVKAGTLKGIAITGESRLSTLPQVPTFTEAGLPGFDIDTWFGILVRAGTPKAIIDRLSAEFSKMLTNPDTKEKLLSVGMLPLVKTPDQFTAIIKSDMEKYAKIIKAGNIKLE